jgi:predicted nucleic acid-binding protein
MSLKVYVDTNIFLDAILNRDKNISKEVLFFLEEKNFEIILNNISIINIHYFASKDKNMNNEMVKKHINIFLEEYTIFSAETEILQTALNSNFDDFEDGVQYFCAKSIDVDFIITNDKKGFLNSSLDIITSKDFHNEYINN